MNSNLVCDEDDEKMLLLPKINVTRNNNHIYFYDSIDEVSHRVFCQLFEEAKQFIYASNGASMFEKGKLEEGVVIHINSPGGRVVDSLAMYDFLKTQDIPVIGIIEGMAASGASILLCGCSVRLMTKHSFALLHELRSYSEGKYSALKDDSINNELFMKLVKEVYLTETKLTENEIDALLTHDIFWDLETCKKYGIVQGAIDDEVTLDEADIKEAIKEKEEELKILKEYLPKKKPVKKPIKKVTKKPASKEKNTKQIEK